MSDKLTKDAVPAIQAVGAGVARIESLDESLSKQIDVLSKERAGEYAKADGKTLLVDCEEARKILEQLMAEIPEVGGYMKRPELTDDAKARGLIVGFFEEVFRLWVYFGAVNRVATSEIIARVRKNDVNFQFGLLNLAIRSEDNTVATRALKKLKKLAYGIASNSGLFLRNGEGWEDSTSQALFEQWQRHRELDWRTCLEFMIDNKFAVVGDAIKNRLIDQVRRSTRESHVESLDDQAVLEKLKSIPSRERGVDGIAMIESFRRDLELSPEGLTEGNNRILAAMAEKIEEPDAHCLTKSQLVEEIKKRAAVIGDVCERQARNDWNSFKERLVELRKVCQ